MVAAGGIPGSDRVARTEYRGVVLFTDQKDFNVNETLPFLFPVPFVTDDIPPADVAHERPRWRGHGQWFVVAAGDAFDVDGHRVDLRPMLVVAEGVGAGDEYVVEVGPRSDGDGVQDRDAEVGEQMFAMERRGESSLSDGWDIVARRCRSVLVAVQLVDLVILDGADVDDGSRDVVVDELV